MGRCSILSHMWDNKHPFEVTSGFVLLIAFLLFVDKDGILVWFLVASAVHELAHVVALLLLGGRVTGCRLALWGAHLSVDRVSYHREAIAVALGPIASVLLAWGAAVAGYPLLGGISLVLGIYNLLPAATLDGGRLLEIYLHNHGHWQSAPRILQLTTLASSLLLAVPLWIGFLNGLTNWTLIASVVYLALSALPKRN